MTDPNVLTPAETARLGQESLRSAREIAKLQDEFNRLRGRDIPVEIKKSFGFRHFPCSCEKYPSDWHKFCFNCGRPIKWI